MKVRKNILPIIILLLISCNGEKKKEIKSNSEIKTESVTEAKVKLGLDKDYSKSTKLFAEEILKQNVRVHTFSPNSNKPYHLKILKTEGLKTITAYSNKIYPKNREPSHYEHFVLFAATYNSNETAKSSYDTIKSDSNYGWTDLKNLNGEVKERVRTLSTYAKYGGMIVRKENHIFSLVKTCGETPIGGKWTDYENKFIDYIAEEESIEVLNADCGKDRYQVERKNASTQQNLRANRTIN